MASLIAAKEGRTEEATEWYRASQEWQAKMPDWKPLWDLRGQAAETLHLALSDLQEEDGDKQVQRLSELLKQHPRVMSLLFRRGICRARFGQWQDARDDFRRAAAESPHTFDYWNALGSTNLYLRDTKGYQEACREAFSRFEKDRDVETRAKLVILCTMSDNPALDCGRLVETAKRALAEAGNPRQRTAVMMALYRAGRFLSAR